MIVSSYTVNFLEKQQIIFNLKIYLNWWNLIWFLLTNCKLDINIYVYFNKVKWSRLVVLQMDIFANGKTGVVAGLFGYRRSNYPIPIIWDMFVMVFEKVTEVIISTVHCKTEDVTLETELMSLGVDSLKALTVLFELEEAFDIEIPNELIPSIVTVNDIVERLSNPDIEQRLRN